METSNCITGASQGIDCINEVVAADECDPESGSVRKCTTDQ